MKLNKLKANEGARKNKHRKGRGHAAGKGKQAGLGQSGQKKRGGSKVGFEGGQNPWFRRLPKRGFNNFNHVEFQTVSLATLNNKFEDGDIVNFQTLWKTKLIRRKKPIKILAVGKLEKKLTIQVDAASKVAILAIEKAGGTLEIQ